MNLKQHLLNVCSTIFVLIIFSLSMSVKAQDDPPQNLEECTKKYRELLEISPDRAYERCQQEILKNCIDQLVKQRKVLTAIRQEGKKKFLIDLGDNNGDWWEGNTWKEKGCEAHTTGPYRRDQRRKKSYEWFRQGWCSESEIILDESYTFDEAKERCELGYVKETKKSQIRGKNTLSLN